MAKQTSNIASRRKWGVLALIVCGSLGAVAGNVAASRMPTLYGTVALLEVPSLGANEKLQLGRYNNFQKNVDSLANIEKSAKTYIDFKFGAGVAQFAGKALLREVTLAKTTDLLELKALGATHKDAEALLQFILADLQQWFQPRLDDYTRDRAAERKALENLHREVLYQLSKSQDTAKVIGYSPVVARNQSELMQQKLELESKLINLDASMSPQKVYNFRFVSIRPTSNRPESPKPMKMMLYGAVGAMLPIILVFFLGELLWTAGSVMQEEHSYRAAPAQPEVHRLPAGPPVLRRSPKQVSRPRPALDGNLARKEPGPDDSGSEE